MNDELPESSEGPLAGAWGIFGPRHVPYRVLLLGKMLDRLTAQHLRQLADLSLAEWRVVAHLAVMGQCSASRLSSAAVVDRAEISRAVGRMEEKGLITRIPNAANRRSPLLGLSEKGQEIYDSVHVWRRKFFARVTEAFDDEELARLDEYLKRMAVAADDLAVAGIDELLP